MGEPVIVSPNPERLRFIARRFQSLQFGGLTWVALGAAVFASDIKDIILNPLVKDPLVLLTLALAVMAFGYIPKYYERRFGHVESQGMSSRGFVVFMLVLLVLMFVGSIMGKRADMFLNSLNDQLHLLISDAEHRVRFGPILYWAYILICCLTGSGWGPSRKDNPWLAIAVVAIPFWGFVFFLPLHHPAVMQLLIWKIVSAGWLGISFMVIGLYEHVTFVRLLPNRKDGREET